MYTDDGRWFNVGVHSFNDVVYSFNAQEMKYAPISGEESS